MSWSFVAALAAAAYGCKVLGLVVIGERSMPSVVSRCIALIPAAVIAALIVRDTFTTGQHVELDERALGVGASVGAAWHGAPLVVVIVVGAGVTAAVRAISG